MVNKFPAFYGTPKVHYQVDNSPIPVPVISQINPLNAELNPICHLLELLGAHHILHVSGLRVNPLHAPASCILKVRFNMVLRLDFPSSLFP